MLLAFDTATTTASLAAYDLDADQLLAEWTWQARRRQTQDLLVAAQAMLDQLQRAPQQITALAVTTGPGSFTGVRIAISAAKGIGIGLPTPPRVVGIPTLTVTAAPWLAAAAGVGARVCAYLQAGRGRYNWCVFEPNDSERGLLWRPTAADHGAGTATEFAAAMAALSPLPLWLAGEPAPDLLAAFEEAPHVTVLDSATSLRRGGQLARVAARHLAAGHHDGLAALQPLYLRKPG